MVNTISQRKPWGDLLRVAAIFMVIIIHIIGPWLTNYLKTANLAGYVSLGTLDATARMAVPVFFMLSGAFSLTKPIPSRFKFYKKVLIRLIIPFSLFSIVGYIAEQLQTSSPLTIGNFASRFLNYPGVQYHMWFMYVIIMIYLFLPYLRKLVINLSRCELRFLIILIFIFSNLLSNICLLSYDHNRTIFGGISLPEIIAYTNYLFLGYYLTKYTISTATRRLIYIIGTVSVVALPLLAISSTTLDLADSLVLGRSALPFFIGLAGFTVCQYSLSHVRLNLWCQKITTRLSKLTFYIYMVHLIILNYFQPELYKILPANRLTAKILSMFIQLVVVFSLSTLIAWLFDIIYSRLTTTQPKLKANSKETIE